MPPNGFLGAAAAVLVLVGLVHSILGEYLIFARMRRRGLVPTEGGNILRERHVRILWATWHALTAVGWGIAVILWRFAQRPVIESAQRDVLLILALALAAAAALVLVGTRGRHPGWIGLLLVALLSWSGSGA